MSRMRSPPMMSAIAVPFGFCLPLMRYAPAVVSVDAGATGGAATTAGGGPAMVAVMLKLTPAPGAEAEPGDAPEPVLARLTSERSGTRASRERRRATLS